MFYREEGGASRLRSAGRQPGAILRSPRVACVWNSGSGRERVLPREFEELLKGLSGELFFSTQHVEDLDEIFRDPAVQDCDLLLVSGGDGTVQCTLSALLRSRGTEPLPVVALVPSGSTNISAAGLYGRQRLLKTLTHLNLWLSRPPENWPVLEHSLMRLQRGSQGCPDQYGFIFGLGTALVAGIEYCHDSVYQLGVRREWASFASVLRGVYGLHRREEKYAAPMSVWTKTDTLERRAQVAVLTATTLERLFFGIRLSWERGRPNSFHYMEVLHHPAKFLRSLPGMLRGKPYKWMAPSKDYRSEVTDSALIHFHGRFTLDGEMLENNGEVKLTASRPVPFLNLGHA